MKEENIYFEKNIFLIMNLTLKLDVELILVFDSDLKLLLNKIPVLDLNFLLDLICSCCVGLTSKPLLDLPN